MNLKIKGKYPLILAILVYLVAVLVIYFYTVKRNDGVFTYALDDPYIHLRIATNLINFGNFGINIDEFSACSSSPLWTFLIAGSIKLFGNSEINSFVLAIVSGLFSIFFAYVFIKKYLSITWQRNFVLLISIFSAPLPLLCFVGLEHILHCGLIVLYIYFASDYLCDKNRNSSFYYLLFLTPIITAIRYESAFIVAVVTVLFFFRRLPIKAIFLAGIGILPLLIMGLISTNNGWFFFPTSILLKGNYPKDNIIFDTLRLLFFTPIRQLMESPQLSILFTFSLIMVIKNVWRKEGFWESLNVGNLIFIAITYLHCQFSAVGFFYRYEAYLVFSGAILSLINFFRLFNTYIDKYFIGSNIFKKIILIIAFFFVISPLTIRAIKSYYNIPTACKNIYGQQYQCAMFLKEFYSKATVVINDIGAMSYYADVKIIDLWGLATKEIARAKLKRSYDSTIMQQIFEDRKPNIAIIYESWFEGACSLPREWKRVGAWKISDNIVCGDDEVSFWAKDSSEIEKLKRNLEQYSKNHLIYFKKFF